jgi:hypothetical protein
LRVEEEPGNQLVASVTASDGAHRTSLDFVHHLRAPMMDFIRRPVQEPEAAPIPEPMVLVKGEPEIEEVGRMPLIEPAFGSTAAALDSEASARPIEPPESSQPLAPPVEIPTYFAVPDVPAPAESKPVQPRIQSVAIRSRRLRRRDHFAGWRWRAGLTFAGVLVLAAILGFGLRGAGKAAENSAAAAMPNSELTMTQNSESSSSAAQLQSLESQANSNTAAAAPPARPLTVRTPIPRRRPGDVVTGKTVAYLDKTVASGAKVQSKPAKQLAHRHPRSRKHSGEVVAADSVTYLEKTAPKAVKPDLASNH